MLIPDSGLRNKDHERLETHEKRDDKCGVIFDVDIPLNLAEGKIRTDRGWRKLKEFSLAEIGPQAECHGFC